MEFLQSVIVDPLTIVGAVIILWLAIEIATFFMGGYSLINSSFRRLRAKKAGTRIIETPKSLQGYTMGGAVMPGSELVIGLKHEWDGDQLKRIAIKSHLLPYPEGTVLKVVRIYESEIEIIEADRSF